MSIWQTRPTDIEKLGVRNSTDFLTNLPQEMGSTINQNMANGGDGSVIPNLRGLLPSCDIVLSNGNGDQPSLHREDRGNSRR